MVPSNSIRPHHLEEHNDIQNGRLKIIEVSMRRLTIEIHNRSSGQDDFDTIKNNEPAWCDYAAIAKGEGA